MMQTQLKKNLSSHRASFTYNNSKRGNFMKYLTLAISCSILALSAPASAENTKKDYELTAASAGCAAGAVTSLVVTKHVPHPGKTMAMCAVGAVAGAGAGELLIPEDAQPAESLKAEDTQEDSN
jgi:cellobiose-specific phosphotransferase system component IIB